MLVDYRARMRRISAIVAAIALSACVGVGVAPAPADPVPSLALGDDAVTVASFDFTESAILAELYAQALERRGIRVVRQFRLGPREFVEPALERGLVELVPEYAGSLLEFLTRRHASSADLAEVRRALEERLTQRGLIAMASAPAQDRNAFATTTGFAAANGVASLSDLAEVEGVTLGGPAECPVRPLCLLGLERVYGISVGSFVALDLSGPLTQDALATGVVDVALVLTTSPMLEASDLVILDDDRDLQPAENVTPVVHQSVVERFGPRVGDVIDDVSRALTTLQLRELNTVVEVDGLGIEVAVASWLDDHGFPSTGT